MPQLNEHQKMLKDEVRKMVKNKLAPYCAEWDEKEQAFPLEVWDTLHDMGLLTMLIPPEYGGQEDCSITTWCIAVEEIARTDLSVGLSCLTSGALVLVILLGGTEAQKQRYFRRLLDQRTILALSATETSGGSDVKGMSARGIKKGDHYILNGTKVFITNGGIADYYLTWAKTSPEKGHMGISCFWVAKDLPGLSIGKSEKKMGMRASPTTEVIYVDVPVPKEDLLGVEGEGFIALMKAFDRIRIGIAALGVGIAHGALDYAVNYAKQRVVFDRPLADNQGIQFTLAEMDTLTHAASCLVYDAAARADQGPEARISRHASMAKYFAGDAALKVTSDALEILGGYGYCRDYPLEKMMRDAKLIQIFEGPTNIQKMIIARQLLN